jgi:hypothetical protein
MRFFKLYNISPLLYGICIKYTSNGDDANGVPKIALTNLYLKLQTFNDTGALMRELLIVYWLEVRRLFTIIVLLTI